MIVIDNTIVSEDIKNTCFACDLSKCRGACCVEGDAGAPLEEEEISFIEDSLPYIKPFMRKEGLAVVEKNGVFDFDESGQYVTPLVNGKECAFVTFDEEGIAMCAIEMAWKAKKIEFKKPESCHLYPARISKYNDFDAVNYHNWHICKPALEYGKEIDLPVYVFLREALTRKYGEKYYTELTRQIESKSKKQKKDR
ncbi:MAG TPA: DUF3109 family protein [Lentimicrobium sp.]|nr:DUF3109 family protein [Lentimicrobium sp.]